MRTASNGRRSGHCGTKRPEMGPRDQVYEKWGAGDFWTPEIFDPEVEVVWAGEMPAFSASTFSCDIAYSDRPAASRASVRSM